MAYLDAHVAHRISTGFRIFGSSERGRLVFGECLAGSIPDTDIERMFNALFPANPLGGAREPTIGVRTSYRGFMDARVGGVGDEGDHTPAHFPAVVIDMVDETPTTSLNGVKRRTKYEQILEVMVIAKSKSEVRAIYLLLQEILLDSIEHFAALGYPGGVLLSSGSDIRPVDAAMGGLMPNMLGMFQRYMRVRATIVRATPRIFTDEPIPISEIYVNHMDSIDGTGNGGKANPK
jgi:hypothetical protein